RQTPAIEAAETVLALIHEKIAELEVRRQELQDFIADDQKIVAPIRKMPNEILAEIFMQRVERVYSVPWNPAVDPEWLLGQVCGIWRAVALSTPRLW
ncbi:hypothetical protein C8F04DRAFT_884923, partial [Mycena alexandri]